MVNEPLAVFFLCTKFTFVETLSAIPKWLMFAIFFLLSYSFIFIQLSIFKSEFHMWSYLFWCLVFCVVRPQLSFFDENINKLILKIGNDKRNQLESSSDWQRKHAGKKHSHFEQMKSNKIVCLIALLKMIIIIVMAIEFEWNWDTLRHHRSSYNYWIFI